MTYKAAVIGDKESVLGFKALGLMTSAVTNAGDAKAELKRLAGCGCAVIFITEKLAAQMADEIAKYKAVPDCAVIPIPSKEGSLGIGEMQMHQAVEKAVGADILKEKEN